MKSHDLDRFGRRVRLIRAWRGLAVVGFGGALACLGWGALDWFRLATAEWSGLGVLFAGCAVLGALVGAFLPVPLDALASSVDRRGNLQDRLRTTMERDGSGGLDAALAADAHSRVQHLKPSTLYPIRPNRWHGAMIATAILASAVFMLGNSPLLLSDQQKKERDELKTTGKTVERVRKEFEATSKQPSKEEKDLAAELKRFQKELEKARMDKQEAMQKANELAKKADELTRENAKKSEQSIRQAMTAQDRMAKADRDAKETKDLQAKLADAQNKGQELQKQMDALKQDLAKQNLSPSERAQMQAKQSELSKAMQENKALQMKLSQAVKDMIARMQSNPLYKEIQELAQKLAKNADQTALEGQPSLTKEQLEEMQKELEELAEKLKDDKAMKEYLEAMKQALEDALKNGAKIEMGAGLLGAFGLLPIPGGVTGSGQSNSPGAPTQDIWHGDSGKINKLDKPVPGQGKTQIVGVTGDRQDKGEETYIEIRGPASLGKRSRVPYQQVLPSYRRRAESAINRQQIPADQQKRVKEYFESLKRN